MNNKKPFGSIKAKALNPGDLVKWSKWNHEKSMWEKKYGLIKTFFFIIFIILILLFSVFVFFQVFLPFTYIAI